MLSLYSNSNRPASDPAQAVCNFLKIGTQISPCAAQLCQVLIWKRLRSSALIIRRWNRKWCPDIAAAFRACRNSSRRPQRSLNEVSGVLKSCAIRHNLFSLCDARFYIFSDLFSLLRIYQSFPQLAKLVFWIDTEFSNQDCL